MPEFFLELFSEEIPARMQKSGWQELSKICEHVLRDLNPRDARGYLFGPRRIAFTATIDSETGKLFSKLRGPKLGAPEAAIVGFARKNSASTENLEVENGYFVLRRNFPARAAADIITKDLPIAVAKIVMAEINALGTE